VTAWDAVFAIHLYEESLLLRTGTVYIYPLLFYLYAVRCRRWMCMTFWVDMVDSERSHPLKLCESVDKLPGRGRTSACSSLSVEQLNSFFVEKVCKVRATTSSASAPTFSPQRDRASLSSVFTRLSVLFTNFQTKAQHLIPSTSKLSIFSLRLSQSCSTDRWLLDIFLAPSRMHLLQRG